MTRRSAGKGEADAPAGTELHYTITPSLVSSRTLAHKMAGKAGALRLSFYALRALQPEALHLRIAEMTVAAGRNVTQSHLTAPNCIIIPT